MEKNLHIWIFAGEASGDLYGAKLAKELFRIKRGSIQISGMGSIEMKKAGVNIMVDSSELGVVGAIEIFKHIFTFINIFISLKKRALTEKPDAVVLIDYPGFNIRFAKQMFRNKIPVIWYISPQVWAWAKGRIKKLAQYCRKMLVIFPFETEVYANSKLDTEFVGHPLVDIIRERTNSSVQRDPKKILLLPGSRTDEISRLLPPMLETVILLSEKHPELKYVISAPRPSILSLIKKNINEFCEIRKNAKLPELILDCGNTPKWQQEAGTGLAASGTVTVECAIAGLPLVVIYKINPLSFFIGRFLIKLFRGFFTMVNIIADKEIFSEFLQDKVNPLTLCAEIEKILPGGIRRTEVEADMQKIVQMLSSNSEGASTRAATAILETIEKIEKNKSIS